MDAVIVLKPEELTSEFFERLKLLAASTKRIEIRLDNVDAVNNLSEKEIDERLQEFADGSTISFTMSDLEAYVF